VHVRFAQITTLVINLDNGPENHRHRTPFLQRLVQFTAVSGLTVRFAYYPPYHSKYNPIERGWGILEQHGNGSLLDTVDTVIRFAESMTWNGIRPVVERVTTSDATGVRLTKAAMPVVEAQVTPLSSLERWFIDNQL
jgi:hypothetical protein